MTITAELVANSRTPNGKTTEMWEVEGAKDRTEALSAIPGDFKVYTASNFDDFWAVEIVRHF